METVLIVLVILHFIGLAMLLGGFLSEMTAKVKTLPRMMFDGVMTQLVTGLAMVGIVSSQDDSDLNNTKVGVKLGVAVVVALLVILHRKKPSVPTGIWAAIGGLTVLNVVVAVAWH